MSKISALTDSGPLNGSELFPIVKSGASFKSNTNDLATLLVPLLTYLAKGDTGPVFNTYTDNLRRKTCPMKWRLWSWAAFASTITGSLLMKAPTAWRLKVPRRLEHIGFLKVSIVFLQSWTRLDRFRARPKRNLMILYISVILVALAMVRLSMMMPGQNCANGRLSDRSMEILEKSALSRDAICHRKLAIWQSLT